MGGPLPKAGFTMLAIAIAAAGLAAEAARSGHCRPGLRLTPTFADGLILDGRGRAPANLWRRPFRSWLAIFGAAAGEFNRDRIPATAAGVAYYCLLALCPAIAAFVSFYGLFGNIGDARGALAMLKGLAPPQTLTFIADQMVRIAATHHAQLGWTFAVGLIVSVWSANAAMSALLGGLNVAYEAREKRRFLLLNLTSLGFTVGAIALAVGAAAAFVAAPLTAKSIGLGGAVTLTQLRWPLLLLVGLTVLAALYRYGPSRPRARWRWLSPGSLFAGVAWMLVSAAFSVYVDSFGHYDQTYGPLGAVVGLMVWLWISVTVVLFGAELNAEIERA